jgi:hypothetical protein
MELEIEKVFSDIRISGDFYGNDFEKVQKIIEPARKILDIMEDNFGHIQCDVTIRDGKVRVSAFDSEHVLETKFFLEISKDSFKCYPENEKTEEIADKLESYVLEIYKNL